MQCGQSNDISNVIQNSLRQMLRDHRRADELFDRLMAEYTVMPAAGRAELFMAVAVELAAANAAAIARK